MNENEYIGNEYVDVAKHAASSVYEEAEFWLTAPETYHQMIYVLVSLMVAYGITALARNLFLSVKEPDGRVKTFSRRWFMRRSGRLLIPLLTILLLIVGEPFAETFIGEVDIIHVAQRVAIVWLMWVTLRAFVTSTLVRTVGIWILLPAALLQLFGWFDPVATYLDAYGFTLGEVKITAYTFIKAVFFVSIVIWIGKVASNSGEGYIRGSDSLTRATKELLIKLFDIVLYAVLFMVTLNLIGIDLTALAVFSGALGVGLGFGLQKIASNFTSGIILLTEKTININDLIEMNDGIFGYVRKLGARASVVETFDGKEVMVPNEDFITSRVANLTHSSTNGRIDIPVGVSYGTDMHRAYGLILDAANKYENAISEGEHNPKCFMREYGDNSVNFLLTFWLEDVTTGRWRAQSDVMFTIWDSFKEHGIEIPFPQRDLHIRSGLDVLNNRPKSEPEEAQAKS